MQLMDDLSGKVVVDLKKLKEIEWASYNFVAGEAMDAVCPACGIAKGYAAGRHAKDCWIGKALKGATVERDTTDQEDSDKHTASQ